MRLHLATKALDVVLQLTACDAEGVPDSDIEVLMFRVDFNLF